MSIAVGLDALHERVLEYGPNAFLVTVTEEGRAHTVTVVVAWEADELVAGAGRTTSANITHTATASLLWPAKPGEDYSLIVDGAAMVRRAGEPDAMAIVRPTRAVLHRSAWAETDGPSCVTIV